MVLSRVYGTTPPSPSSWTRVVLLQLAAAPLPEANADVWRFSSATFCTQSPTGSASDESVQLDIGAASPIRGTSNPASTDIEVVASVASVPASVDDAGEALLHEAKGTAKTRAGTSAK